MKKFGNLVRRQLAEKNGPKNGQNIAFQYIGVPGKGGPFQVILLVRKKPLRSLI